jgi:regulator of nucleoside diphosphate kinase
MALKKITISEFDHQRLQEIMAQGRRINLRANRYICEICKWSWIAAEVLPADQVPDVITMESTARLMDLDTERETEFTLVFPDDADPDENKISVLAPIGCAMLGYREGDEFEWETPQGNRRLRVVKVEIRPAALIPIRSRMQPATWKNSHIPSAAIPPTAMNWQTVRKLIQRLPKVVTTAWVMQTRMGTQPAAG